MKFKNPLKHLEPEYGDSLAEMMQGAFWTMIVIACAQLLFYFVVELAAYQTVIKFACHV